MFEINIVCKPENICILIKKSIFVYMHDHYAGILIKLVLNEL